MIEEDPEALRPNMKFGLLELGRGLAATMVVLYHAARIVAEPRFWGSEPFGGLFRNYNAGVDFFFVLSGFIITWAHWDDLGRADRIARFAKKRFLRIYPPYWIILTALLIFYGATGAGTAEKRDAWNIMASYLLIPNAAQPVLGVAWTLVFEIFFYGLFALAIPLNRLAFVPMAIWASLIIAAAPIDARHWFVGFVLSPYNLEFMMGVLAAALLRRYSLPAPALWAIGGAVLFLALAHYPWRSDTLLVGRLCFGLAASATILGCATVERRAPAMQWRSLKMLGASSYALYLTHPLTLILLCQIMFRIGGRLVPIGVGILIMTSAATAVGIAYHLAIERPTLRGIRLALAAKTSIQSPRHNIW